MNIVPVVRARFRECWPKQKFTLRIGRPTRVSPKTLYVLWVAGPSESEVRQQIRWVLGGSKTEMDYCSDPPVETVCGRSAGWSRIAMIAMGLALIEQCERLRFETLRRVQKLGGPTPRKKTGVK